MSNDLDIKTKIAQRRPTLKADVISSDVIRPAASKQEDQYEMEGIFGGANLLRPSYDPELTLQLWENSSSLPQNVAAYVVNIDGLGHKYIPRVDFKEPTAPEKVRDALWLQRVKTAEMDDIEDGEIDLAAMLPTDEEVEAEVDRLSLLSRLQRLKLEHFFDHVNPNGSFIDLRRSKRQDEEITGNAYWEVLRDASDTIARFVNVAPTRVRLTKQDDKPTTVEDPVQVGLKYETVTQHRFFRRYAQRVGSKLVWFKEYGDPRVVSRNTGDIYNTLEDFEANKKEPTDVPATEMLHFKVERPGEAYGVPRWVGCLLSVVGSRATDEVNYDYFDNKGIPPLALLVEGGRLDVDSVEQIRNYFRDHIKGQENFHKILVVQTDADPMMGDNPNLKFEKLTDAQNGDALFQKYDERNIDKVGGSFRLPRLVRGDSKDYNRACYDEKTETLTENGWKTIDEFTLGERIAAYDKNTGEICFVVPSDLHVYHVDEELLHFKTNVADVMVTKDHTMLVSPTRRDGSRSWEVHKSQNIPWTRYAFKTTAETFLGKEVTEFNLPKVRNCRIERGHDHASVSMDTFLEFLGYWISEGSLLETQHLSSKYLVTLVQKSEIVCKKIQACIDSIGWKSSAPMTDSKDCTRWHISNQCLREWLKENCGSKLHQKHLPKRLLSTLSGRQQRILFNALMDGDGHWDRRDGRTCGYYNTTSRELADDVQQLAFQLGYRASLSQHYPAHENRKACWRVSICTSKDAQFRSPPERIPYKGRVYCFSVPTHGFFVTRRNGKIAIQGNTAQAVLQFVDEQVFEPERKEFDAWVNRVVFPALGITMWRFKSNGPQTRDAEKIAYIILNLVKVGVLTPNEARDLAGEILDLDLDHLDAGWAHQPLQLTLAGFPPDGSDNDAELAEIDRLARDAANNKQRMDALQLMDDAAANHDDVTGDDDGNNETETVQ